MTHTFHVDLGPKRYLGPRDAIIGNMARGGGYKLKVQGSDSYPVNECTHIHMCIYIHIYDKVEIQYRKFVSEKIFQTKIWKQVTLMFYLI